MAGVGGFFGYKYLKSTNKLPRIAFSFPTTSPSEDNGETGFKTYTNTKYGYSINYPDNWTFREFPSTKSGAGFRPMDKPDDIQYEFINISARQRTLESREIPFDEYVKTAATHEIQNYESLASIEKVVTKSGITGYKTTWNVQSITGSGMGVSRPITYFDLKDANADTIQVSVGEGYDEVYNQMIVTFDLSKKSDADLETGSVLGKLCYPSSFLPPGEIVAKDQNTGKLYSQVYPGTMAGGALTYNFSLPPGIYHLRYQAHASTSQPDIFTSGYFDECAKTMHTNECTPDNGHVQIDVTVTPGTETKNIDLCDFYYNPLQKDSLEQQF